MTQTRTLIILIALCSTTLAIAQEDSDRDAPITLSLGNHPDASPVTLVAARDFPRIGEGYRNVLVIAEDSPIARQQVAELRAAGTTTERNFPHVAGLFAAGEVLASAWPPTSKTPYYTQDAISQKTLWRSLGWLAPDLVIVWRTGETLSLGLPAAMKVSIVRPLTRLPLDILELKKLDQQHLASALMTANPPPAGTGTIAAMELTAPRDKQIQITMSILHALRGADLPEISPAHRELIDRRSRTPVEIARQLDVVYGHDLNKVMYQPALALMARLALDDLLDETSRRADVERIVADYVSGTKPALGANPNGSVTSGHLIFADLAHRVSKDKYLPLVKRAADQMYDASGQPRVAMPAHSEMSDAVFMGGPILAAAGRLTGDETYYDLCLKHVRFMQNLCRREDGIYRHSPLDEAAWGRGNGFPALGLALCLSELPPAHPVHEQLRNDLDTHLRALIGHRDPTGMWRQVIDHEGSYREMTSTCMITFAMLRGLREGWLDQAVYEPIVESTWPAIAMRISAKGELIDVCTGTGKQQDLQAYFDRAAILGKDERGGAMAFLVVTEYAKWKAEQSNEGAR